MGTKAQPFLLLKKKKKKILTTEAMCVYLRKFRKFLNSQKGSLKSPMTVIPSDNPFGVGPPFSFPGLDYLPSDTDLRPDAVEDAMDAPHRWVHLQRGRLIPTQLWP